MQKYLTVKDVAERFGVSTPTIWHWLKAGQLPKPVKISAGCTRWKMSDLLNWEEQLEEKQC